MGLFRRGATGAVSQLPGEESAPDAVNQVNEKLSTGPWDVADDHPAVPMLDLGALRVPTPAALKLRLDTNKDGRVILVRAEIDGSEVQLAPFAAPRTEGIWDEIREEIAAQITTDGGSADELDGPFGRELLTRVMVRTPEGRSGTRTVRFMGVDGPRWFLRGVVTGPAATDPERATAVEDVFSGCVVVRGTDAMPPRDLLVMHLPDQPAPVLPPAAEPDFDPLTRGPEITEIR